MEEVHSDLKFDDDGVEEDEEDWEARDNEADEGRDDDEAEETVGHNECEVDKE
jgi:hypothetical protein